MKILKILQIIDEAGRLNLYLILTIMWALNVFLRREVTLAHIAVGLIIVASMQLDRFFRSRDNELLSKAQEARIVKIESELNTLTGLISMNQRMF